MKSSIEKWMKYNKMSAKQLADKIGVSRISIYNYIQGKNSPTTLIAMKLRKLTGLKFSQIIDCSPGDIDEWERWCKKMEELENGIEKL